MNYKEYDDNELLSYVEEHSEDAKELILKKYEPYIQHMETQIYKNCIYKDRMELGDLVQEGLVGLMKGIETYHPEEKALFYTYAKKCIDHEMLSYVIQVNRQKYRILNESVSLEMLLETYENYENIILKDQSKTPEEQIISNETEKEILETLKKNLSDLELEIFELKMAGFQYKEISNFLEKDRKVVDNTLQRIKSKLKKIISDMESQD